MRQRRVTTAAAIAIAAGFGAGAQSRQHLNPMIDLLEQHKPVFGLYRPQPPRPGGSRRGQLTPPASSAVMPTPADLARQTLDYEKSDFVFDGSMERNVERALPGYAAFATAMRDAGALVHSPFLRLPHPLVVKTPLIAPDPAAAVANIGRQLNLGVSGIMFVGVESADEVRQGLAAMRFKSNGGTRPDDVGSAPEYLGHERSRLPAAGRSVAAQPRR